MSTDPDTTTWSAADAAALSSATEVDVVTTRRDGTTASTTIWIVADGSRIFVRSTNGAGAAWYRRATARPGAMVASGVRRAVRFAPVQGADLDIVDSAYRRKYGGYASIVDHLQSTEPRAATLEVLPA